jgi:hypothetical protein
MFKTHLIKLTDHSMNISPLFLFFDDLLLRIVCWLHPDATQPHWSDALVPLSEEDQSLVQSAVRNRVRLRRAQQPPEREAEVDAEWELFKTDFEKLTPENQERLLQDMEAEAYRPYYREERARVIARRKRKFLSIKKGKRL